VVRKHGDLVKAVTEAVAGHPAIATVRLAGSRARGDEVPLSDWDFAVETEDFDAAAAALPRLVEPLAPLTRQWDRLSGHPTYMLMLRGPVKVDFLFLDRVQERSPPWAVGAETLAGIDAHFWDWILWIASKAQAGRRELVERHLHELHEHVLVPMGVPAPPEDLGRAIDAYEAARARQEHRLGVAVDRALGSEVSAALERVGYRGTV
jgi:predicted nucleotidyltransferase